MQFGQGEVFEACWEAVKRHFYDKGLHGVDWEGARGRYEGRAVAAQPGPELHAVLAEMLGELKASHVSIMARSVYEGMMSELQGKAHLTFGILLEESMPGRFFLRAAFEGGPAGRAGLLFGDRIVAVEGEEAAASAWIVDAGYDPGGGKPRLLFFRAEEGRALRLVVQRTPAASSRFETTLEPALMCGVDAAGNSARVVERDGLRIGTAHLWYCQRGAPAAIRAALQAPLAACDALILDLRGRGGHAAVAREIVNLFRPSRRRIRGGQGELEPAVWSKPVVFLIDERTRSAKEMLAHELRAARIGPLVGTRTEGAVLGAGFFPLPDGSVLELPIADVVMEGVRLEGIGVAPDHEVDLIVPYAAGFDSAFERALDVAVAETRAARRRAREFIRAATPPTPAATRG